MTHQSIKPLGRTLDEFLPLKTAEQKLLVACRKGEYAVISNSCPQVADDGNTVRAGFLRFLALGGDDQAPVHEHGVKLSHAWIEGKLDLMASKIPSNLTILYCHFNVAPELVSAVISGTLNLGACHLPGLKAGSIICDGDLYLHQGLISTGEIEIIDARIGGNLVCRSAIFDVSKGDALSADRAIIQRSAFFDNGFITTGPIRLHGAKIGGALQCSGATFNLKVGRALAADGIEVSGDVLLDKGFTSNRTVSLVSAQIGGNLDCSGGQFSCEDNYALSVSNMAVEGIFYFRKLIYPVNGISLVASHVKCLADDDSSWGDRLVLDGFLYDSIIGGAPTDAPTRLAWLEKQNIVFTGFESGYLGFAPQPWKQLSKVLREMGHAEDARQVSIAFEHRLRKTNRIGQTPKGWGKLRSWFYRKVSRGGHWLFWLFTGYGYRPLRLLGWIFAVWLVCSMLYWYAAMIGTFAPSDPLVFQNKDYAVCSPNHTAPVPQSKTEISVPKSDLGAGNWYFCEKLPEEYSGFSPLAYSLDVLLPFVDLQQERSWAPLIPTPKQVWHQELFAFLDWKHITRLIMWFEILFGWIASLLLVAVVSGLTKHREE